MMTSLFLYSGQRVTAVHLPAMSQQLAGQGQHLLTSASWTKGFVQNMKSTRAGARSSPRALRPHSLGFPTLPSVVTVGHSPLGSAGKTLPHIDLSGCRVQPEGNVGASCTLFWERSIAWEGRHTSAQAGRFPEVYPCCCHGGDWAWATVQSSPPSLPQLLLCPPRTGVLTAPRVAILLL